MATAKTKESPPQETDYSKLSSAELLKIIQGLEGESKEKDNLIDELNTTLDEVSAGSEKKYTVITHKRKKYKILVRKIRWKDRVYEAEELRDLEKTQIQHSKTQREINEHGIQVKKVKEYKMSLLEWLIHIDSPLIEEV